MDRRAGIRRGNALAERLAVPRGGDSRGDEKRAFVEWLGADQCCAVGNALEDAPMLRGARLRIAIIGPEGASSAAVAAVEVVCASHSVLQADIRQETHNAGAAS
jgi:soluble P-type ATPase